MRELNAVELQDVDGGGGIALLAVLGFVYYERENIRDFFEGFFNGYEAGIEAH